MIYRSQYSTILEIAGLFQDYVIRIYSGWIDVEGYKANIQDLDLHRTLIKYIMGLGTINFTVQIEHI